MPRRGEKSTRSLKLQDSSSTLTCFINVHYIRVSGKNHSNPSNVNSFASLCTPQHSCQITLPATAGSQQHRHCARTRWKPFPGEHSIVFADLHADIPSSGELISTSNYLILIACFFSVFWFVVDTRANTILQMRTLIGLFLPMMSFPAERFDRLLRLFTTVS